MSEMEDAILVERMEEVEAEKAGKPAEDLLDFGDTPVAEMEESPVSSTTDQLMDFTKPETTEPAALDDSLKEPTAPVDYEGVQEIAEQEPLPVPQVKATAENVHVEEQQEEVQEIPKKKELTSCVAKCLMENNVDARIIDLIYWTCWKRTAAAFGGVMFVLTSLICCTFISVVTKFSMAILAVAFLYRIGMTVFNAVQKTSAEHPFRNLLDEDLKLSEDSVQHWANKARSFFNAKVSKLQKLFLIEDAVESVKFGVMLWLLSYVGSCFSMLTLSIIACVLLFTVPMLYERHQEQVDKVLKTARSKTCEFLTTIQAKLPEKLKFGKAKAE